MTTTAISTRPVTAFIHHPYSKQLLEIRTFDAGTEFRAEHTSDGNIEVRVRSMLLMLPYVAVFSPSNFALAFTV